MRYNESPWWRKVCCIALSRPKQGIWHSKPFYFVIQTIRGNANQWFRSYLSNRKQKVFVNGVESNFLLVNSGVPQGSILGPFLFLIYVNDFERATNYFSLRLFADDTSLTATGKDLDVLLQRMNSELPAIYEWLCSNRLTLNLSKTKYLVFQPRQKISFNLYPPLKLADQYL